MIKYLLFITGFVLFTSCNSSNNAVTNIDRRHHYSLSNDSIEQTLELFSMDDSTAQFTLRVENKYQDTLDSYMSHAKSVDGTHFIHTRNNCAVAFELTGVKKDTAVLTNCNCPELTVKALMGKMTTDTTHIIVYR